MVGSYRARSSIHSVVSLVAADTSGLSLPKSIFQQNMITADFEKHSICTLNCDYLIIDLIDERFEVITNFGSLVTLSNELKDNNDVKGIRKFVERGTKKEYTLWRKAVKQLATMIDIPVILHKSRLASRLNKTDRNIAVDKKSIDKLNRRMRRYEKIILQELDIFGTIDIDEKNIGLRRRSCLGLFSLPLHS